MMLKGLLVVIAALPTCPILLQAQTADEIISKHIQATGGLKRLKSIQTMRIAQRVNAGDPTNNVEFVVFLKRGHKFRMEQTTNFKEYSESTITACDGGNMWSKMGNMPAQVNTGADSCRGLGDIDSPLLDYRQKGYAVQLVGKERIEGRDTYHLILTRQRNDERPAHYYFDAQSFLLAKISTQNHGQRNEDIYSDYREVQGIMFAFCDEMRWWRVDRAPSRKKKAPEVNSSDQAGSQKQLVEKLEFNVPLNDSLFSIPKDAVRTPAAKGR